MQTITKQQAKQFILSKQGLIGQYRFIGKDGAYAYVRQAGCIQFDPVDVCGKNAELNAKDLALYEERSKVMQLEYQQKRLIQLLERIPPEMRDELMNGKKTKERQD